MTMPIFIVCLKSHFDGNIFLFYPVNDYYHDTYSYIFFKLSQSLISIYNRFRFPYNATSILPSSAKSKLIIKISSEFPLLVPEIR